MMNDPAWVPGSPSKVWELPGDWRRAYLLAKKKKKKGNERESEKSFIFLLWFLKNIAKPKELFGGCIFQNC